MDSASIRQGVRDQSVQVGEKLNEIRRTGLVSKYSDFSRELGEAFDGHFGICVVALEPREVFRLNFRGQAHQFSMQVDGNRNRAFRCAIRTKHGEVE